MAIRVWDILPDTDSGQESRSAALAARMAISPLAARVLTARGMSEEDISSLLHSKTEGRLYDPMLMRDMDKAVAAVREAIENGTLICVFGDYDCDGISATAIVHDYLTQVGARVCYRIPDREREGYGLNKTAIRELFDYGVRMLLTVDNGISAVDEIAFANSLGMQVVVTDHHTPPKTLPDAAAVVNPHREDCSYPYRELCGAGVAFKLCCALEGECGYGLLEEYGDLLCIGTIADVVEMRDENRVLVARGLELLENTERCGLRALLRVSGYDGKRLGSDAVSFGLAPRMNAAGRISSAETVVELLRTESESEADELAETLNRYNAERRAQEKRVLDGIAAQLAEDPGIVNSRVLVLDGEGWNAGIVGIVCSRLVERFGKPCLIIARDGALAKGSGRSVPGFSLIDAVTACSEHLTRYGGHPLAAGFSLMSDDIPAFRAALERYAAEHSPDMPALRLQVDCVVPPELFTVDAIRGLDILEPHGNGSEAPVFAVCNAHLDRVMPLSGGKYGRLMLTYNGVGFSVVCFTMPAARLAFFAGESVDVAVTADINEYQGKVSPSLRLCDIRFSGEDTERLHTDSLAYEACLRGECGGEQCLPTREECAVIYRYFRAAKRVLYEPQLLYRRFARGNDIGYVHFRLALDILLELGLLALNDGKIEFVPGAAKVDLRSAGTVRRLSGNG